jgi:hypothetical protein
MARQALVGVEARPQPIVVASCHDLDVSESRKPIFKERAFIRGKALQGTASPWGAAAHTSIHGLFDGLSGRAKAQRCQNRGNE